MRSMTLRLVAGLSLSIGCAGGCGGGAEPEPAGREEAPVESAAPSSADIAGSAVELRTSMGIIKVALDREKAPITVDNFLGYAREGFYDGTVFHRVIDGFMIQGGGFTPDMTEKETKPPIENEARNGLRNLRGAIAMARTQDPHSASSQFFINSQDNARLDYPSFDGWGYAVFGNIVEGLEVVDRISKVPTTSRAGHDDVPVEPVVIESIRVVE